MFIFSLIRSIRYRWGGYLDLGVSVLEKLFFDVRILVVRGFYSNLVFAKENGDATF